MWEVRDASVAHARLVAAGVSSAFVKTFLAAAAIGPP